MKYLLIQNVNKDKFKIKINKGLSIEPIKILIPDAYILPDSLLGDKKIMKNLSKLGELTIVNLENITLMPDTKI